MRITKLVLFVTAFAAVVLSCTKVTEPKIDSDSSSVEWANQQRKSDVQVEGEGVVSRILSDDEQGSRHQRFIVGLRSGQTVLIHHNIDLAPRINDLKTGDTVSFYGEYIWNDQGGLIHWTHHDPAARHAGGWLKHNGRTYQ